ncbi:MAG: hypothetical protein ACRELG_04625 [Gemmataceae bacterium]
MESKRTCPECHLSFEAPLPETGVLACPLCNTVFAALPSVDGAPSAPVAAASSRQVLRGVLVVAALLFLVGGLVYAYQLMGGIGQRSAVIPAPAPAESVPRVPEPPPVLEITPLVPTMPPPPARIRKSRPSSRPPELTRLGIAEEPRRPLTLEERVNHAIDRGIVCLRKKHNKHNQYRKYLGLLGLTLLECGIPAGDASVQEIAAWIRSRRRDLTQTYELSLAILFLDRLGEPRDQPLIRTFGQRLLFGRLNCGAWTYSCQINDPKRYQSTVPLIIRWPGTPIHKHPNRVRRVVYRGDNSNTQFAILGLWVAQRHGVPSHSALLATEQYFRATQLADGSWSYHPNARLWRDSMTCAGLMSVAMRYGAIGGQGRDIRPDHPLHVHDGAINQGLRALAQSLDKISVVGDRIIGVEARDPLYFLWSLERMAVIYDLKKIGPREWYPWAAEMLVATQRPDGGWTGLGDPIGTCFALLILKRSNFAKDLQLAVQESPSRPLSDVSGPTILQGMDAFMRPTGKPHSPNSLSGTAIEPRPATRLGPSITRTQDAKP